MIKRAWALVAVIAFGSVLFLAFQNFVSKDHAVQKGHRPASEDFNAIIDESLSSQHQLATELEKAHPPERLGREGLVGRQEKTKREVIEGTQESVIAKGSQPFFKTSRPSETDDKKTIKRLSQEVEGNSP